MNLSLLLNTIFPPVYCDAAEPWAAYFQDSATPLAEGIIELHDHILYFLIVILITVSWMLITIVAKERAPISAQYLGNSVGTPHMYKPAIKDFNHGSVIEVVWTIIPALILVLIAFPSFKLLYLQDEVIEPSLTVKAIGHQWYWSYEYSDELTNEGAIKEFDSYMIPTDALEPGDLRLLDVDNRMVVPTDAVVRLVVSSTDVIHSWAVPSLGIKVDAIPGRLNQVAMDIYRPGTYYGMCSELCGVNHGFMPIAVEAVPVDQYVSWLLSNEE